MDQQKPFKWPPYTRMGYYRRRCCNKEVINRLGRNGKKQQKKLMLTREIYPDVGALQQKRLKA